MNGKSVILFAGYMAVYDVRQDIAIEVGAGEGLGIEQHVLHISRKTVSVPSSEMREFVPPQEEPFEVKR